MLWLTGQSEQFQGRRITTLGLTSRAALSYSARGYDSAVCCSKMSRDAFLSEALYEAVKMLTEETVICKCMFYFVILRNMSINGLHLCLRLLCRLLHCCKLLSKYAARL